MDENPPTNPINRLASLSLVAALFTVISFCIAISPIPLTGWICFPAAAITGLVALATGLTSLYQIGSNGSNGRIYGIIGAVTGGITTLGSLCALISAILWFPILANFIRHLSK